MNTHPPMTFADDGPICPPREVRPPVPLSELAGLPGMPRTKRGVRLRMLREEWPYSIQKTKRGGRDHIMVCTHFLPAETQAALDARTDTAPRPVTTPTITLKQLLEWNTKNDPQYVVVSLALVRELRARFRDLQDDVTLDKRHHLSGLAGARNLEEDLLQESLWNQVRETYYRIMPHMRQVDDLLSKLEHQLEHQNDVLSPLMTRTEGGAP